MCNRAEVYQLHAVLLKRKEEVGFAEAYVCWLVGWLVGFTKRPWGFGINALFTSFLVPTGHPTGLCLTRFQVCLSSIPKLRLAQVSNLKAQGREGEDGREGTD